MPLEHEVIALERRVELGMALQGREDRLDEQDLPRYRASAPLAQIPARSDQRRRIRFAERGDVGDLPPRPGDVLGHRSAELGASDPFLRPRRRP